MRTKQRNFAIAFVGFIMAIAMVLGFTSLNSKPVYATASGSAPTVTMVSGAQARYNSTDPGIKFTAEIENFDSSYTYGMLILPEKAFTNLKNANFIGRYHAYFNENGITNYADYTCGVYNQKAQDGSNPRISLALTHIHDYSMGFVGVAYTLKNGEYTYAEVNMADNARSIAFVAQMALKNETNLDAEKIGILKEFVNGDYIVVPEDYLNNGNLNNSGNTVSADYAMKYIFNAAGESVSQVTKSAYAGGSTVSFKYYIPAGTVTSWWGISWSTTNTGLDIYATADANTGYQPSKITGAWTDVSFTLPAGGPYYLYFGSEVGTSGGRWMLDGENSYVLIDDFKVGSTTETFASEDLNDSIFTVLNNAGVTTHMIRDVEYTFDSDSETPDYSNEIAMKIMFNNGDDGVRAITKNAYAGGSTVEFMYYIQADTVTSWWGIAWHTVAGSANNYHAAGIENPVGYQAITPVAGEWTKVTLTLSSGGPYYLYFGFNCGAWQDSSGAPYILIDNFTVNGEVETFNDGIENSSWSIRQTNLVSNSDPATGFIPLQGEFAVKFDFTTNTDSYTADHFISKEAIVTAGDIVTFKYRIPSTTTVGDWWGMCWDPNKDFWLPSGYTTYGLDKTNDGEWREKEVTITGDEGASYQVYFCIYQNWNGPIYIDDFTVTRDGQVVVSEDFNSGVEESIFYFNSRFVSTSEDGDGYSENQEPNEPELEELGDVAMKYIFNASGETVSQVTKTAYAGGSTVSFKYYLPTDITSSRWWGIVWSTSNNGLDIYAAASNSSAYPLSVSLGTWTDVSFTLPSGGPYYLYFGSEVGNWKLSDGSNAYALIDEFTINGEVETFNYGVANSIFNVLVPGTVVDSEVGEGWINPYPGTYGAKLTIDLISSTTSTPSFITAQAYTLTQDTVVTFDYYMTGNTNNKWWTLNWTTSNTSANVYAFVEPTATNDGRELTKVQDAWTTASVTVPAGTWYFYFAGAIGEWGNGSVTIDNFKVGDVVFEDFSNGLGIFLDNRSSKPDAIVLAEGKIDVPAEYAAKLTIDLISTTASTPSFITKEKYVSDGTLVVTFDYYMSGNANSKWWAFFWTNNNKQASIYAHVENNKENNNGIDLPTGVQDQWATASVTIPAGEWYFYIAGAVGEWSGGYVLVDNFKIGNIVTENFNDTNTVSDAKDYGIFFDNRDSKPDAITLAAGNPPSEEPTPEEPEVPTNPDPNALENLLYNGTIVEYLENGGSASISQLEPSAISSEDIPETMLFIEGTFNYAITGEKEFAIYLGNGQYIVIDQDSIALYVETTLIREVAIADAENQVFLAITANGKVIVGLDATFVGLGELTYSVECVKFIALGGTGRVVFTNFNIIAYRCLAVDVPSFDETGVIDFSAYAFDSEAMVSDAGFQLLSEAGFTKTLPLLQGRVSALQGMYGDSNYSGSSVYNSYPSDDEVARLMAEVNADAHKALDLAQKYGMQHYVFNEVLYNLARHDRWYADGWLNKVANASTYLDHPALAGHVFVDEPSNSEITATANAYNAYVEAYGRTDAYVNLLPQSSTLLSGNTTYTNYVKKYITNIATGTNGSGFVSYDHYPLKTTGIESKHLKNFEIVAELCKEYDLEFRYLLKASVSGDGERNLRATQSINDLYMQIYSALCFGVEEIGYYQFTDHTATDGSAGDAVISGYSLEKTNVYEWAKQANNEVHAFENAYMSYDWNSSSVFGSTSITQFSNLGSTVSNYGYISSVSSSASVLVGNFDDADGIYTYGAQYAYMVMSYGNTNGATTATTAVTITFNGTPTRALVYQGGVPQVVELTSNTLTLNLMLGEGAFVIPLTNVK